MPEHSAAHGARQVQQDHSLALLLTASRENLHPRCQNVLLWSCFPLLFNQWSCFWWESCMYPQNSVQVAGSTQGHLQQFDQGTIKAGCSFYVRQETWNEVLLHLVRAESSRLSIASAEEIARHCPARTQSSASQILQAVKGLVVFSPELEAVADGCTILKFRASLFSEILTSGLPVASYGSVLVLFRFV